MQVTANKGIRYPLLTEAGDPNAIAATIFDLDTVATAEDALRTTALTQRGAIITNSTGPSVAKATVTKLTFDTVMADPNGLANLGVNNDRFTITKAGLYLFGAQCSIGSTGATGMFQFELTVAKNTTGSPAVPNIRRRKNPSPAFGGSGAEQVSLSAPYVMAAGDFVTLQTFWNGSGAGPVTYSFPYMWVLPIALT